MKKLTALFLLQLICCGLFGGTDANEVKRSQNERILDALGRLHCFSLNDDANPNDQSLKAVVDGIEDPRELARLMVISYYLSYPGDAATVKTDAPYCDLFENAGMLRMEALSGHRHFAESLQLIANAVRLDAGRSLLFRNLVVKTLRLKKAQEMFPDIATH